jgi:hypothetical protein
LENTIQRPSGEYDADKTCQLDLAALYPREHRSNG